MNFGYKNIMQANSRDVHNAAISTKIIQLMDKIRDYGTDKQARRWVWELIQNAKDAAYTDKLVKIKIELFNDKIIFSHNGRPFLVKNILSIINQVSSKAANDNETTGKFGTGFISTHLLSEVVQLDGILQDYNIYTKELLPAKKFSILLDRSGKNAEEIMTSVQKSLDKIELLDNEPDLIDFPEFTTSFTYMLNNNASKKAAKIGIEDLNYSILYALAFVERLGEIQIVNHIDNTYKSFVRANPQNYTDYNGLSVLQIKEDEKTHHLLILKQDTTILAAEFNNNKFLPIHAKTPRIFVDFPLIGSEIFPFPVVMCDRNLLPDEPRSWIPLSEKITSKNSQNNKVILQNAIKQCNLMFKYACELGYENFYEVCKIQPLQIRADFDIIWYKNSILNPFWIEFNKLNIINTANGKLSLNNEKLIFPVSNDSDEINTVYELLSEFKSRVLPNKEDIKGWSDVFSIMETLPDYAYTLRKLAYSATKIYFKENDKYITWLQKLYNSVLNNVELINELKTGNLKLFPDQNEKSKLHSINEMYLDPDIDDAIKKAMCQFNIIAKYSNYEMIDIYSILLHKNFNIGKIDIKTYPVQELLNKIEGYSNRYLKVSSFFLYERSYLNAWFNGWLYMLSCDKENTWFNFACDVFPESTKDLIYKPSKYAEQENIWRNSKLGLRELVCEKIKSYNTFEKVKANVIKTDKNEIDWLFDFIDNGLAIGNISVFAECAIFPNQNNNFCSLKSLYKDANIDEDLKDIAFLISKNHDIKDFRDVLLHKSFKTNDTAYVTYIYEREIATDITRAIDNVLNTGGLSETDEQMQDACTKLLSWIEENPEKSANLFTHYTLEEARMKLLTPKAAVKISRQVKQFEQLMKEYSIENIDEFKKYLKTAIIPLIQILMNFQTSVQMK